MQTSTPWKAGEYFLFMIMTRGVEVTRRDPFTKTITATKRVGPDSRDHNFYPETDGLPGRVGNSTETLSGGVGSSFSYDQTTYTR